MVGVFHALGVRQVHLAYNRNNEIGGGCYDEDIPLSPLGRQVVEAIHGNGMLMDLSHTGHRTSLDIAALGLGPVIFSHSNPRNIQHDLRNITDEHRRLRRHRRHRLRQRCRPLPHRSQGRHARDPRLHRLSGERIGPPG